MTSPGSQEAQSDPQQANDESTLNLLEQIKAGSLDPSCIRPADRCPLVAFLMGDGYSTAEIARILKVGDRTIERDKKAIREANALAPDLKLVEEMTGRLKMEAELSIQQIRRTLRDKNTPSAVKVDGNHRCFQIFSELIQDLQRLGYLPTAAQRFDGTVTHHLGQLPSLEDLRAEVKRLEVISQTSLPNAEQAHEKLKQLEQDLERADLAAQVQEVSSDLSTTENSDEQTE